MYARTFNCHLRMSLHSIGPVNFYASIVHFSEGLAQMTSRSPQHEYEFLQGWLLLAFSLPQGVYQNAISIPSPQKQIFNMKKNSENSFDKTLEKR